MIRADLQRWGPLAVVSLAVLIYLNVLPNTFIFDDWQQIFENPYLRDPHGLRKIFTSNVWGFEGKHTNYYRPLMHLTFYVAWRLFGYNPAGYHALSLLLHALVSLLVCFLVGRLTGDRRIGLVAGLLFAAHPIHTENVCWISGYPDLQATLFILLAWWLYLLSPQPGLRVGTASALALCFFLGLLAKEIAVVMVVMALAYEFFTRRDGFRQVLGQVLRERWREYLGMSLALGLYLVLRYQALGGLLPYRQIRSLDPETKLWTTIALFYRYWAKILWPAELNAFPHFPASGSFWEGPVLAGAATTALFLWLTYRLWRGRRPEALGMALFLAALAPALTLPYGDINMLAERYLYLPSVGFCWLVAWLLVRAGERRWGKLAWGGGKPAAALLLLLLAAYSARAWARNLDWRSEIHFYEKSIRMSPDSAELHTLLGEARLRRNMLPEALAATQRAAALRSGYAEAHNNLGQIYSRMGQPRKAIEEYARAAQYALKSNYPFAAARSYTNLGYELRRLGRIEEAIHAYNKAIELEPGLAGAQNNLGYLLMMAGRGEEAETYLLRALRIDPTLAVARSNLGLLYAQRGDLDRATIHLTEAARLEPRDGETFTRLGHVALARGDRARAEALFRQALKLHPNNQEAIAGLAEIRGR